MKEIKVGVIGCGGRGAGNFDIPPLKPEGSLGNIGTALNTGLISVVAVCDVHEDKAENAALKVEKKVGKKPLVFTDYKELLKLEEVNTVLVFTSWETHIPVAIDAMKAGKAVGMEVGGATNLQECFDLVETWEQTRVPFMFLENCCYNKPELLTQNLVRAGKFGDIVYCHGAYGHDLRKEVTTGKEHRHYRLNNYITRNCDNYPTHALGPICKTIDVNRGNKMNKLYSVATKSLGLKQYVKDKNEKGELVNKDLLDVEFNQGDIVDTIINCENGEVISLRLDTTLPRTYSREYTVVGTKGRYFGDNNSVFLDGDDHNEYISTADHTALKLNNADRFYHDYVPECWKTITEEEKKMGHGGMDYILYKNFFTLLKEDKPMPMDVYDAAAWMCISPLSEESIRTGMPVEIPDFTKGAWKTRERLDVE